MSRYGMDEKHRQVRDAIIRFTMQETRLDRSQLYHTLFAECDATIAELAEALELADCALSGSNMNMNVVQRKVKAALEKARVKA
jgi:hypothetical protein